MKAATNIKLLQDYCPQQHAEGLRTLLLYYNLCSESVYSFSVMESRVKYTKKDTLNTAVCKDPLLNSL